MIKKENIKEGMWFTMDCNGFKYENMAYYMLKFHCPITIKDLELESLTNKILFHLKSYNPNTIPSFANTIAYRIGFSPCFIPMSIKDFRDLGTPIHMNDDEMAVLEAIEKSSISEDNDILINYTDGVDRNVDYVLKEKVFTEEFCKKYGVKRIDQYIDEVTKPMINTKSVDKWIKECEKDLPKAKKDLENIISNKMVGKSYCAEWKPLIPKDLVRFGMITKKMRDMFERKNKDYGNSFKDLYKEYGMTYPYIHLREKLKRIGTLMNDEAKVEGESMKDSLYDIANYAVLTIMELERKENGKRKDIHRN